ncbi:hypothetical protein DZG00_13330 [Clavibacter lycopersici]|uniref:Uncharacterized protein n=1 Tax=Clavibacter lycopersici TaxID=2301718 RepID=A0A399SYU3_9MICO|nr:hypothetical protein [Clavibacter lycopersici]RIJ47495.1 hypothetical protein DZG00_13330 [Clavibacter lycopersici]RIJ59671.1 hypothetical protein DZG02_11415 [Clavibacter lycopersici]
MARTDARLEVVALSPTEWRVCDARIGAADATRIIAYAQRRGGRVELMRMRPVPGLCDWFGSLDDALAAVAAELPRERALIA